MKGTRSVVALALLCAPFQALGFAPSSLSQISKKTSDHSINTFTVLPEIKPSRNNLLLAKASSDGSDGTTTEGGFLNGIKINPPYALAYVLFLAFAYVRNSAEPEGLSLEIIQQYINDPLNPGMNELFASVFNILGLYATPLAAILMPGAKNQKLNATPFLLGSCFGGYGVLGIYASTLTPNPTPVSKDELGWFTANVLENKLFNYFIVLVMASAYVTTGALAALISDPASLIEGYATAFSESAIVSASSLDFVILTASAASFIPDDLKRRGYKGELAPELIGALTVLLPGLGAALYCALRPTIDEE